MKCTSIKLQFNEALNKEETIISSDGCGDPYERSKHFLKKITHSTQPLEEGTTIHGIEHKRWVYIKYIDLSEVKELIGEVDVEKKILKLLPDDSQWQDRILASKIYNQALEDNKDKKYTEEDVIAIVEKSRATGLTAEYIIQSLQTKTEWEVEIVDGKLKLK